MALTAAILWGVSGTCAQFLFQHRGVNTEWLVTIRLLVSGTILLSLAASKRAAGFRAIWRTPADSLGMLAFAILGILAVQYTYFAAINNSNAATATILQYLGPALIACYLAIRNRKPPTAIETIAIASAMLGTALIATHGDTHKLSMSRPAFLWGIASAFALAFYALQPVALLKKWSASVVIGWGMFIGGVAFSFVHPPWQTAGHWDMVALAMLAFIILFGSFAAFYLFLTSVKILGSAESTLLACAEPLSAAILAVVWLHVSFSLCDWLGAALILTTILLLSLPAKNTAIGDEPLLVE